MYQNANAHRFTRVRESLNAVKIDGAYRKDPLTSQHTPQQRIEEPLQDLISRKVNAIQETYGYLI